MVIVDDIISAVDAHTQQHIIKHCFKSVLMADWTVIMASHAVEALAPLAELAVFLADGKVAWSGKGPDLIKSSHMEHLQKYDVSCSQDEYPPPSAPVTAEPGQEMAEGDYYQMKTAHEKTPMQQVLEETRAKGRVDMNLWWRLKADIGGNWW